MKVDRWRQIDSLFHATLELESERRAAFLDEACSGDQTLRSEVESLLATDIREWSFIERTALEGAASLLANDRPQLTPGQSVGHYEIVSLIGKGGMGEVYLAKDTNLNRRIALKLLPADYTADKDRLRRFQQEAQAASALNHPNILTIHELVDLDGQQFIATEFVEGETLRRRTKSMGFSVREALDICIQIAGALTASHTAGIIHRDIKPENIMLRPDGYVKVLDFGLAKLTEQKEPTAEVLSVDNLDASSSLVMGTVKYMSPEQTRARKVDARSDIFSLGVVLYEMVTGHTPFAGNTAHDLIHSILKSHPTPIKEYLPEAPVDLQTIVDKSLAKNRAKRYQTAEDLLVDLKSLRQQIDLETDLKHTTAPGIGNRTAGSSTFQAVGQTKDSDAVSSRLLGLGSTSSIEYLVSQIGQHKPLAVLGLLALVVLVGSVTYSFKRLMSWRASPFEKIKVTRLTSSGNVITGAISPDARFIGYSKQDTDGSASLWIRGLVTNNDTQILTRPEGDFNELTFSRDGKYLYYLTNAGLSRIPSAGGTSEKVLNDLGSFITFSPDGERFAFIRSDLSRGITTLVIVNADGKGERTVATRQAPNYFSSYSGLSWSPDGKSIACVGANAGEGYQRVFEVSIETGDQKPLTPHQWNDRIDHVAWLPDSSGILLIVKNSSISSEIWRISYPSGELERITNDVNLYHYLSLSSDSNTLLTLQVTLNIDLWIAPDADSNRVRRIIPGRLHGRDGLTWTPDGRVVYTSVTSSNSDIWIMNSDGTNQKQLTTDVHNDVMPSVTADGRYIVFQSNRTGADHIWRMDIDGGNEKQITFGAMDQSPSCSPDSKWVVFNASESGKATVWKTSIQGGEPVPITNTACLHPAVSPNGKLIACWTATNQRLVFPFEGGIPTLQLSLPTPVGQPSGWPVWTPDSQALTYTDWLGVVVNFWNKPIDGSPPIQLTNFKPDEAGAPYGTLAYAWAPNGKDLAYARYELKSDMVLISDLK